MNWVRTLLLPLILLPVVGPAQTSTQSPAQIESGLVDKALRIEDSFRNKAFRTRLTPNWLKAGALWYRMEIGPNRFEWVHVSATGEVRRFPSQEALRQAIGEEIGEANALRLSDRPNPREAGERVDLVFENQSTVEIELFWLNGSDRVAYAKVAAGKSYSQSTFSGHAWEVRSANGKSFGYVTAPPLGGTVKIDGGAQRAETPRTRPSPPEPSRKWSVSVVGDNVVVKARADGAQVFATTDGKPGDSYQGTGFFWSPDGTKFVAFRTVPEQEHKIHIVSSSPRDQLQPKLITLDYLKPGDRIAHPRPVLVDLEARKTTVIDDKLFPNPWSLPPLGDSGWGQGVTWAADSSRFWFAYNERGHQLMRMISLDASTGTASTLFEDRTKSFIHYSGKFWARYLPKTNEILWMSERDGWNHLYAHDATTGALKRQLTRGNWVVRGVESFDADSNTMLLKVAGRNPKEDPYHVHFARLDVSTGKLTSLTEGDGTHQINFSPDGSAFLDSYSRVDLPPVTELRRSTDGKLLATLERGDISALRATGWRQPERFVGKGRDGKTDIWGVLWRPTSFDPKKQYPVIEQIYAGPQGSFVPKQWSATYGNPQQLAELGFLVVQIDGMGTDGRGKAFHDVAYKNLKDAGFPDRIAWMRAFAKKEPSMDLTRVGIYGGSAGGQNAMAAVLWHGDFYKAAAADCGCHDNRMDKIWWNEQWMGYPVDKAYEDNSNMVNAHLLQGKLLLTVGELDTNVDPATTLQVANALIRAGKDFELVVFPGGGHGAGDSPHGKRKRMEFFIRNLFLTQKR